MSDKQRQFDYDRGFAAGTAECDTLRAQLAELRESLDLEQKATAKWQETAIQTNNKMAERDALLQSAARALEAADALEREAFKKGTANVGAGMFRGMRVLLDQYTALSASAARERKP